MFSIHLLHEDGRGSYLSVKGRTQWSDKRRARYHAQGLTRAFKDVLEVTIEDEDGRTVETVERRT